MIGQQISQYKIIEKLGEGGMGIVYKAHDTKLDRTVALKFLPHHLEANEAEQARFLQEARAASALNHPNVCTIYDIKEESGQEFIVMEYVDGTTLNRRVPIPNLQDALGYAMQIGDALHEAHAKGIVHRDLKCENIMVNTKNQVKVMDFGLAKLKGSLKLTKTSSTVGTLAYMAPEQIQGGEVDARSDIFSFGVVLFEMLTGHMPFRGEHEAAVMYSIVNDEPESLLKSRPDLAPELDRIVQRALEKEPEDRYQSVADMVSEIRRQQKQSTRVSRAALHPTSGSQPSAVPPVIAGNTSPANQTTGSAKSPRRLVFAGVAVIVLIAALAAAYLVFFRPSEAIDSIAVLPFTNAGNDPNSEYLSDGITESLINGLSQLSHLTVMSRSSVFHYKGKDMDPQAVGKELHVKAVLTGRLIQRGDNLQISAELVNVSNNSHLWGDQYNKKLTDLIAIQEDISREISQALSVKLVGDDEKKLSAHATENTEAYQLYLKGRFHWNKRKAEDLFKAVDYFQQAIAADNKFALAYAGLATTYVLIPEYTGRPANEFMPKARESAQKALEYDPSVAEAHAALALINHNQYDRDAAEREIKKAIELNPNYPTAYHWYSIIIRSRGRVQEALPIIRRAQELDPLSLIIGVNLAEDLDLNNRHEEAIEQFRKTIELDPNFPGAHIGLSRLLLADRKYDEALAEVEKGRQLVGEASNSGLVELGMAYFKMGKADKAREILDLLLARSKSGYSISVQIAAIYVTMGDNDKAMEWLNRGVDEYSNFIANLKIFPVWDPLRNDPRFIALLKRVGLDS